MDDQGQIVRTDWRYWIDGAGAWATRWHCTSEDLPLAIATIAFCALMIAHYLYFAMRNHIELKSVEDGAMRRYLIELRNVFVVCGCIHGLGSILSYFWPLYWIQAAAFAANLVQMVALLRADRQNQAMQEHRQGVASRQTLKSTTAQIDAEDIRATTSEMREALDRVRAVLKGDSVG